MRRLGYGFLLVALLFPLPLLGLWQPLDPNKLPRQVEAPQILPEAFRLYALNRGALESLLAQAPLESGAGITTRTPALELELPTPDGALLRWRVVESPIMQPQLAARYPNIRTYLGRSEEHPALYLRFSVTPLGFHGQVLGPQGRWYLDPYALEQQLYLAYHRSDYPPPAEAMRCLVDDRRVGGEPLPSRSLRATRSRSPQPLRSYRLALATTGEYGQYHGGSIESVLAAVVTTLNRVNGIYEQELGVRLLLVEESDALLFTDPESDPFSGNDDAQVLLNESQQVIDQIIGDAHYDIGHTFSTGAGGLAWLGVVCRSGEKARGVTGRRDPLGDPFAVDYVAHELGHQFNATHTFNGALGSCTKRNRWAGSAYEPGSGSTIMAYAGICKEDNLQANSDPFFHSASLSQIRRYVTLSHGSSCATLLASENYSPEADAGGDYTIPHHTPFVLTGWGFDPDPEVQLSYAWEQLDLGPQARLDAEDDGLIPLFRSYPPTLSPRRWLPALEKVINNQLDDSEKLPQQGRTLTFQLTVRDGRGETAKDLKTVVVDPDSGPFRLLAPSGGETLYSGEPLPLTWAVAHSDQPPVNAQLVDILLSSDGGVSWDLENPLAVALPNSGEAVITLPDMESDQVRLMVKGHHHLFYDVTRQNLTLRHKPPPPAWLSAPELCGGEIVILRSAHYGQQDPGYGRCSATSVLQAGGEVTVGSGAEIYYLSPMLQLQPGFRVEAGGYFFGGRAAQ